MIHNGKVDRFNVVSFDLSLSVCVFGILDKRGAIERKPHHPLGPLRGLSDHHGTTTY